MVYQYRQVLPEPVTQETISLSLQNTGPIEPNREYVRYLDPTTKEVTVYHQLLNLDLTQPIDAILQIDNPRFAIPQPRGT